MKPRGAPDGDESNVAAAIRGSLDASDAAVRAVLMDTRSSQALETVKLPTKLRTRIEKAQRRAAAAKDGVSIFTSSSDSKELHSQQSSTQPDRLGKNSVLGLDAASALGGASGNQEKNHLPAVVMSHKMRDFEAKTHVNSLLLDPLDKSLNRLSIEDKERVMLRMQTKIQQITADIDANFIRIKQALDANGIFDPNANAQRAQALCLVELQKRCKLEAIRDEAIKEVLASSSSGDGEDDDFSRFDKHHHRFSGKLNALLSPHKADMLSQQNDASSLRTRNSLHGHGSRLPKRAPKQQLLPTLSTSNVSGTSRARSRENTTRPEENHRSNKTSHAKDEAGLVISTSNGSDPNEIMTRHAHIANVLSQLREIGMHSSSFSHEDSDSRTGSRRSIIGATATSNDADFPAGTQVLSNTDAWRDRSASYVTIAERVSADLRQHSERMRWDSLVSFTSIEKAVMFDNKPLLKHIQVQRERLAIAAAGIDMTLQAEQGGSARESITEKRMRMEKEYRQRQEQIQIRLQSEKTSGLKPRQSKNAVPKAATVTVNESPPLQLSLIGAHPVTPISQRRASTVPLSSSNSSGDLIPPHTASEDSVARSRSLHGSVSAPVLEMFDSLPNNDFRRRTQIMAKQQTRTRHRKESLIGAPVVPDGSTIGRHSNARMEERRYSAQTWAWHAPESNTDVQNAFDAVMEENNEANGNDSDADSANDGPERRDEDEDGDSDGSVATSASRPLDSARSSRSVVSPTTTKTRHAQSKHKKKKLISNGSNNNLLGASMNAQHMQLRIESIWKALEIPFSLRLIMLEKYADVADADAFQTALRYWEQAAEAVVIRERMVLALQEYGERKTLATVSLFTEAEWASVRIMQISVPPDTEKITVAGFIAWINAQINAVTLKCQACARELKAQTGDDLHFQGGPYPPSHRGF